MCFVCFLNNTFDDWCLSITSGLDFPDVFVSQCFWGVMAAAIPNWSPIINTRWIVWVTICTIQNWNHTILSGSLISHGPRQSSLIIICFPPSVSDEQWQLIDFQDANPSTATQICSIGNGPMIRMSNCVKRKMLMLDFNPFNFQNQNFIDL